MTLFTSTRDQVVNGRHVKRGEQIEIEAQRVAYLVARGYLVAAEHKVDPVVEALIAMFTEKQIEEKPSVDDAKVEVAGRVVKPTADQRNAAFAAYKAA